MVSLPKSAQKLAFVSTMATQRDAQTVAAAPAANAASLEIARKLQKPSREAVLRRDSKVYDFWNQNEQLLERAWKEWNQNDEKALALPKLDASLVNPKLREAVEAAWKDPVNKEQAIKELWTQVAPGVYAMQFLDLEQLHKLRQWLDVTADAGIPTRPPYGIVLNTKGKMVDPRSVGYLAAPDFQDFYQMLVNEYIRPLGRLFFPESIRESDDSESFAFTIQYQGEEGGDKSIRPHSDASTVTFNINLDATQSWTGSSLIFFDRAKGARHEVTWAPGIAVMHLGRSMHAALPIESGTRSNWVIWTMGKNGAQGSYGNPLISHDDGYYPEQYQLSPEERWTKPKQSDQTDWGHLDRWSPF